MAHLANNARTRVIILVDTVSETHQAKGIIFIFGAGEKFRDIVDIADFHQHFQHRFIGAAVRRSPQCGDARRNTGKGIGQRASGQAHCRRAGVLLVVDMQDEDQVERFLGHRVDFIGLAGYRIHHFEQVARVAQRIVRIDLRFTDRVLVTAGGDRRHFRDQAMRRYLAMFDIADIGRVVVESRQRANDTDHGRHRVGIVIEAVEQPLK